MVFTTRGKRILEPLNIKISEQTIDQVDHTKFLGVVIDDKLNWYHHLRSIKNKMAKGIGVICKAKRLLPEKTLITLYYSFLYPYLHYGILAWGCTYQTLLDPIVKMQNVQSE